MKKKKLALPKTSVPKPKEIDLKNYYADKVKKIKERKIKLKAD